jgi:hypothetical protein
MGMKAICVRAMKRLLSHRGTALAFAGLGFVPVPALGVVILWAWLDNFTPFATAHGITTMLLGAGVLLTAALTFLGTLMFLWSGFPLIVALVAYVGGLHFAGAALVETYLLAIGGLVASAAYKRLESHCGSLP